MDRTPQGRSSLDDDRLDESFDGEEQDEERAAVLPVLVPLTPRYDPDKHEVYVDAIESVLEPTRRSRSRRRKKIQQPVRNIALTGSYGVGKSSVLSEVARRHPRHVISISLSSTGIQDEVHEAAPGGGQSESDKTNRIQKEIVKQLLYSQDPVKTPGSRYKRTTRLRFWRLFGLAVLFATIATLVFYLTGWTAALAKLVPNASDIPWLTPAAVFVGAWALVASGIAAFHNRLQIEKLDTGAGSISLSARTASYFDEYLDEIVYLFETSNRTIVIFEDIDRFDSAQIFETLRSLNSILSGARQLRGRSIQFIYAIKDSIFDELGTRAALEELRDGSTPTATQSGSARDAAEVELARANRTKFFDLVIPVVPFVTHRSARDHVTRALSNNLDHHVSADLIELVSQHVADMRLITNIRNEFAIFRYHIIEKGKLQLSEDNLFAMIVYKNVHLTDFERIKFGDSDLDRLYGVARQIVAENTQHLGTAVRQYRSQRTAATISEQRAEQLGAKLREFLARTFRQLGADGAQQQPLTLGGEAVDDTALNSVDFWMKYVSSDSALELQYVHPSVGRWQTLTFHRPDLEEALGQRFDEERLNEEQIRDIEGKIDAASADRDVLAVADMSDLFARPEFTFPVVDGQSFAKYAAQVLESSLAVSLVEQGYIDRNFTLYTSTFETRLVSTNAMNYMLKNVDTKTADLLYPLTLEDAAAILRERGHALWQEPSAANTGLLEYALRSQQTGLQTLIQRFLAGDEDVTDVMLEYLVNGARARHLVINLAGDWNDIFTHLTGEPLLNDEKRLEFTSTALMFSRAETDYNATLPVGTYLADNAHRIVALSTIEEDRAAYVATQIILRSGAELSSFLALSDSFRARVIEAGAYAFTKDNLAHVTGDNTVPSLDSLATNQPRVYLRAIRGIREYLSMLEPDQLALDASTRFAVTIEDVRKSDPTALAGLLDRAHPDLRVPDLRTVSDSVWTTLIERDRYDISAHNVAAYVAEFGVDDVLAASLSKAGAVTDPAALSEDDKKSLAVQIIASGPAVLTAEVRARLAESLQIEEYLEPDDVPEESGELVGWLIATEIIDDDAASFAAIGSEDLEGLLFAISMSDSFTSFMTTTHITSENIGQVIESSLVPSDVKDAIVARITEFAPGATRSSLTSVSNYLVTTAAQPTLSELEMLARGGVPSSLVIPLLRPRLSAITLPEISPILEALGGAYRHLRERNGRRPRVVADDAHRALLDRLRRLGVVSSFKQIGEKLHVNMKR